ncbi:MAG TPA: EAL domain-containing protein [Candidatus Saccharimonadales bacterium]|nr:EAL domain-containing protein [Candidatus Saccharimonadales bacterium]
MRNLRLYKTMFERGSLGQLIVDYASMRVSVVNDAFCSMSGFSADGLVGRAVGAIFPVGQDPSENTVARLAESTTDGYFVERTLQRRDGSTFPVMSSVSAVRDKAGVPVTLFVLFRDLTTQRAAEGAQRRSEALIDAAVAALPVAFSTFDRNLRLTFVASGASRPGGVDQGYLGRHISELSDNSDTIKALEQALSGSETTSRTLIGGNTYLGLNAPMRDGTGAIIGVVSVSSDISAEVAEEARRRRADEARLFAARHDPLTGLLHRAALVEHLNDLAIAGHNAGGLLLLDLDDFNVINDSLGHDVGDAVLLEVARRVSSAFRGSVIAKYGADEFAVVAPFVVDRESASLAAQRIRAVLEADVNVDGRLLRVTGSLGVALEESFVRGSSPSTLVRNADSALSNAKHAGTGQYRLYDAAMRREVSKRLAIQDGLRVALSTRQLHVAYQPIVSLSDRDVVGAEALLRWIHPEHGAIAPAEFIPVAERSGLIVPIGRWVMDTACRDMRPLRRDHGMYVAVNVSVRQLVTGGFAEWVEEVLARSGMPASALTVEVTEGALVDDISAIRVAFNRLRASGVRVSIDDFGTGYSSLSRLHDLPIDVIKLDRAFVIDVDKRAEGRAMAAAILQLSTAIGASIIAEGIETEAESAALVDIGYTTGQGYLFARPMPIDDLVLRLNPGPAHDLGRVA